MALADSNEKGEVMFMAISYDERTGDPVSADAFYERVQAWCESHGIILGEGRVALVEDTDRDRGHDYLQLCAPRISGPILHEAMPD